MSEKELSTTAAATAAAPESAPSSAGLGTTVASTDEAAQPKRRLLKDVQEEENRFLYEALYKSLDDDTDQAIRDDLTVGGTVRQAREAKREFIEATTKPIGVKAKDCGALLRRFSESQNQKVASVFIIVTFLMFTVPLIVLGVSMKVVAPHVGADPTLCGGLAAVFATVFLMIGYVVYAMVEDANRRKSTSSAAKEKIA